MKTHITLAVQGTGNNKFRFGISTDDSKKLFRHRRAIVELQINNEIYNSKTTCGCSDIKDFDSKIRKKGYDLYSKKISDWIICNNLHCFNARNPTKVKFTYELIKDVHKLRFVSVVE